MTATCPSSASTDTFVQGLLCLSGATNGTASKCCELLQPFEDCTELMFEALGGEDTCVSMMTKATGEDGVCYVAVGVVAQAACNTTSLVAADARIPQGAQSPAHAWAYYLLLVLGLGTFLACALHHGLRRRSLKYQAVYLVIMVALLLALPLTLVSLMVPAAQPVMDLLLVLLEGYLAFTFGGLMVSWAAEHGKAAEALRQPAPGFFGCTPTAKRSGPAALKYWRRTIAQLVFVKAATALVQLSSLYTRDVLMTNVGLLLILGFTNTLSTLMMLKGLTQLYLCFRREGLLTGLNAVRKFAVIKITFTCIVANNIIVGPLLSSGAVQAPAWVCANADGTRAGLPVCEERFINFVFMCEVAVLLVLGAWAFSASDFTAGEDFGFCALLKRMFASAQSRRLWREAGGQGDVEAVEPCSSEPHKALEASRRHERKASVYRTLGTVLGASGAVLLLLGLVVPLSYTAELDGCKVSLSYMAAAWCHGSCPTAPPASFVDRNSSEQLLLYQVCHAKLPGAIWVIVGGLFGILAPVLSLLAVMFRDRWRLVLAGLLGLISFALLPAYGVPAFEQNVAIATLREEFGMTAPTVGPALVFQVLGAIASFACAAVHHRLQVNKDKLWLARQKQRHEPRPQREDGSAGAIDEAQPAMA